MTTSNTAFHLNFFDDELLDRAFYEAPNYECQIKRALERVLGVVHGLPRLHSRTDAEQLDIYVGRCSRSRLGQRFKEHRGNGYKHGAVLFTCSTENAPLFETAGIAVVQELKTAGVLCVNNCNVKRDGYGSHGRDTHSAVYIVWRRTERPYSSERPTAAAIRGVVERVDERLGGLINKRSLLRALLKAKRLHDAERLRWAPVP